MIIDDDHFAYLRLQRGALDHLSGDRAAWQEAYERSLQEDLLSMRPFLPHRCGAVLDVGSGLGGINVLLDQCYWGMLKIRLLDGETDPPIMRQHASTYSHKDVALDFLRKNGVRDAAGWEDEVQMTQPDLVISIASWCFHYPPAVYLENVSLLSKPGTVLILDVRAGRDDWRQRLCEAFDYVDCAKCSRKFNRLVFRARAA